jgi:hypothetical protein
MKLRGPLSLVSATEELLGRKSSHSGLENREYSRSDPLCWPRKTLYPQKVVLTSLTSFGLLVNIVRSQTQATELHGTLHEYHDTWAHLNSVRYKPLPSGFVSVWASLYRYGRNKYMNSNRIIVRRVVFCAVGLVPKENIQSDFPRVVLHILKLLALFGIQVRRLPCIVLTR